MAHYFTNESGALVECALGDNHPDEQECRGTEVQMGTPKPRPTTVPTDGKHEAYLVIGMTQAQYDRITDPDWWESDHSQYILYANPHGAERDHDEVHVLELAYTEDDDGDEYTDNEIRGPYHVMPNGGYYT